MIQKTISAIKSTSRDQITVYAGGEKVTSVFGNITRELVIVSTIFSAFR
jgi:hypothetical protein